MGLFSTIPEKGVLFLNVGEGARLFLLCCKATGKKHATLINMNFLLCSFQGFCQEFK